MLRVVATDDARTEFALTLDEICRRGAERMLAVVLEAEVRPIWSSTWMPATNEVEPLSFATATRGRGGWWRAPAPWR